MNEPDKIKCHKCGSEHIQQSKEDWWLCSCGSYHKVFPYKCPIKQAREDFKNEIMKLITQYKKPLDKYVDIIEYIENL